MSRCTCHDVLIVKDLNRWFKEKWVDVSRKDKDGKHPPCGRSKAKTSSKGYPKCRPSVKVSDKTPKTSGSMSEGQKRAATKRKRAKKQGVGGKPTIVKAMDEAWAVLKRQTELGEHHADLPSSQGPVLGYHGRNASIKHGISDIFNTDRTWMEILREDFDGDYDAMRDAVAFAKDRQIFQEGLRPSDTLTGQVGSGRRVENYTNPDGILNPDIPANVSVAVEADTAADYAQGMAGHKDASGHAFPFGIRAGAFLNAQDINEPRRLYVSEDGNPTTYGQRFRFISGGVEPNQLARFDDVHDMKEHDKGVKPYTLSSPDEPSKFITHGPTKIFEDNYSRGFDLRNRPVQELWARSPGAHAASEAWINQQVTDWQNQQAAQQQSLQDRMNQQRQFDEYQQSFQQQTLPVGVM